MFKNHLLLFIFSICAACSVSRGGRQYSTGDTNGKKYQARTMPDGKDWMTTNLATEPDGEKDRAFAVRCIKERFEEIVLAFPYQNWQTMRSSRWRQ